MCSLRVAPAFSARRVLSRGVDKTVEEWVSPRLQRPIKLARWGYYGVPVVVFPTAGGDAEEIERHHLVSHLRDMIDGGQIKLYSCDSVAGAVMLRKEGSPEYRMWLLNQFQQAHDVKNLFVVDGAGFVSAACQNPTWTIMALCWRSCDYLAQELHRGNL